MKRLLLAVAAIATIISAEAQTRTEQLLERGWRFTREDSSEFVAEDYDDKAWKEVTVPHDWAIYGPFNPVEYGGTGKLPWRGVGWYRHEFTLDAAEQGKCVILVSHSPDVASMCDERYELHRLIRGKK